MTAHESRIHENINIIKYIHENIIKINLSIGLDYRPTILGTCGQTINVHASCAGGWECFPKAGQILHSVANSLPLLQHLHR